MAQFDMRGQKVTNQYNAGRDINFGSVQNPVDLVAELEKLKEEFTKAKEAGIVSEEQATTLSIRSPKLFSKPKSLTRTKRLFWIISTRLKLSFKGSRLQVG